MTVNAKIASARNVNVVHVQKPIVLAKSVIATHVIAASCNLYSTTFT